MPQPSQPYRYAIRDGLRSLRKRLGWYSPKGHPGTDATPQTTVTLQSTSLDDVESARHHSRELYSNVGLHDSTRAGWFNRTTQELFTGFPIRSADTVVDVGCGLGGNLRFCADFAQHLIGIDIDPERVEATRRLLSEAAPNRFDVLQGNGERLPVDSASADKIICTEVIEHVDSPSQALQELVRIGKPGALYLLSVPGQLSEELTKTVAPASWFEKPNHIRILGTDEFRKLVESSGLQVERHEFAGFYWTIWHIILCLCQVDHHNGTHPALDRWSQAWDYLLSDPQAKARIRDLDQILHKSQIIIARKPA
ncbi:MAG TPA: class I SAM-dependent methyltransferase [Aquabacterium sp.]|nr:class I SAM-dependent methyltransferase [Aquabacterium sp.]